MSFHTRVYSVTALLSSIVHNSHLCDATAVQLVVYKIITFSCSWSDALYLFKELLRVL